MQLAASTLTKLVIPNRRQPVRNLLLRPRAQDYLWTFSPSCHLERRKDRPLADDFTQSRDLLSTARVTIWSRISLQRLP